MIKRHLKYSPQNSFFEHKVIISQSLVKDCALINDSLLQGRLFSDLHDGKCRAEYPTPGEAMWEELGESFILLIQIYHCRHAKTQLIPSTTPYNLLNKIQKKFGIRRSDSSQPLCSLSLYKSLSISNLQCPHLFNEKNQTHQTPKNHPALLSPILFYSW